MLTLVLSITSLGVSMLAPSKANAEDIIIESFSPVEPIECEVVSMPEALVVEVNNDGVERQMSPVITLGEEQAAQAGIISDYNEELLNAYIESIHCDPNDIRRITNLKREDMHLITDGTWWSGYEDSLYDLEQNYHINAAFAMAVSSLESGRGTSAKARNRNNYYGLATSTSYGSRYECTMYFGDIMNRLYVNQGKVCVNSIGPKYCPPNREWEKYMTRYMNNIGENLRYRVRSKNQ